MADFIFNLDERVVFGVLIFAIYMFPKFINWYTSRTQKPRIKHTRNRKKLFDTKARKEKHNFYDELWENIK